ncbi:glutamate ABC transporter substrate-binding protein [Nocardia uniformis]|uniref:Glutamate ABC transporter substrate-binding protein n=1 Tax=Nocardia uniformis TaxID=53432 RepID=A0A849CA56_9NOCA|nr:glutamate ABC transporter substrate-binding protein [Nocardia uniformis]NNH73175.1 glutamate ABC transporter substrate-binding protein [Nocardia uniformis]
MNTRLLTALLTVGTAALVSACGGGAPVAEPMPGRVVEPMPPAAVELTSSPNERGDQSCDATASLRPGPLPAPGAMPAGSTMAEIVSRGVVRVGVNQDMLLFGFRNPTTGGLEGFDIDIARAIAQALFGDPNRIDLQVITSAERVPALREKKVDLVVHTFSATCERRREVEFSSTYFISDQRILAVKGSGIRAVADLTGKRVCGVFRTTTLEAVFALPNRPTVIGMTNWLDCLVALQQGQVDAVSTDEPILAGLAIQDPTLEIVGAAMAEDAYAVGVQQEATDLVRFVNGVLDRLRSDGSWDRIYTARMGVLGPSPGPPQPRYVD